MTASWKLGLHGVNVYRTPEACAHPASTRASVTATAFMASAPCPSVCGRGVLAADGTPPMRGDALAAVEDLDGGRGQAGVDVFVDERVGDRVVVAVELDVIVDADAGADLPVAVDEGLRGERAQRGVIQPLEELAAAC